MSAWRWGVVGLQGGAKDGVLTQGVGEPGEEIPQRLAADGVGVEQATLLAGVFVDLQGVEMNGGGRGVEAEGLQAAAQEREEIVGIAPGLAKTRHRDQQQAGSRPKHG